MLAPVWVSERSYYGYLTNVRERSGEREAELREQVLVRLKELTLLLMSCQHPMTITRLGCTSAERE